MSPYHTTNAQCYLFCLPTTQPMLSVTYSVSLPHNQCSALPILSPYHTTNAQCYLLCLFTTQPMLSVTYSVSPPHNQCSVLPILSPYQDLCESEHNVHLAEVRSDYQRQTVIDLISTNAVTSKLSHRTPCYAHILTLYSCSSFTT